MSKQFKKYLEDTELFEATKDFVLNIERPSYNESMSFQDYGAMCVAFDKLRTKLKQRFDALLIEAEKDVV